MKPVDLQVIGTDLAMKWENGEESFISLKTLRKACPCASCKGEMDIFGNVYKGNQAQGRPESTTLVNIAAVGGYGIQPAWADGHSSGIFSHEYLRGLVENA